MAVSENRRPPSPDGPARLVNNYLSAAAHESAAQAVLFFACHGANPHQA
jgi:hypothetical protein